MNHNTIPQGLALQLITPAKALSASYRKQKVARQAVEAWKLQLRSLQQKADPRLSEETLKNLLLPLLEALGYGQAWHISVNKDRQDLSIHLGKTIQAPVGVIVETKRPGSAEMMTADKPNTKALHELILYYLRERNDHHNNELKHLIATDVFTWVLIDANELDKKVYGHSGIRKLYEVYRQDGKDNGFFYTELKKLLDQSGIQLQATLLQLEPLMRIAAAAHSAQEVALLPALKLLSPVHLLKQRFANDSNALDKGFYSELLHLIGLEEAKADNKKIIRRKAAGQRHEASLLENTLLKLQEKEALRNLSHTGQWGATAAEQYFGLALELCITWVNRILFLKLLEAQLCSYHPGQEGYRFLQSSLVHDFDELANLFFAVLAEWPAQRKPRLQQKFARVPYLNSSLFERTELERRTLDVGALDNRLLLPTAPGTILKAEAAQHPEGLPTLEYIFRFLNAYDFGSEGSGPIQDDSKRLINASVLGLIFEKLNGYKDGSYYTPGFITMYMVSETLRRAVVARFNAAKGWQCRHLDDVYNRITDLAEANAIVNSLRICDPAVGSGHFLVSALNELLLIKHDLRILTDRQGRRLKEYTLQIENDELLVSDEAGEPFVYKPGHPEYERVQATLFHEKQTLIENCLFGADINPNSVKICRLRLWIELLKNAYYTHHPSPGSQDTAYSAPQSTAQQPKNPAPNDKPGSAEARLPPEGEGAGVRGLETLPNIDINIQTGNSLVARFGLQADLSPALRHSRWNMESYRLAVRQYHHAASKAEKRSLEELIDTIKKDFKSEVVTYDPINKAMAKLRGKMLDLTNSGGLFGADAATRRRNQKALEALSRELEALEAEKQAIRENKVYADALEWRFVFPEVLDNEGTFTGFDVVLGNPPYIRQEELGPLKDYLKKHYATFAGTADLYVYFVERAMQLLRPGGFFCYILPNKWMKGGYGQALRTWAAQWHTEWMVDFGDLPVFEEATTYPSIWLMEKKAPALHGFAAAKVHTLQFPNGLEAYLSNSWMQVDGASLQPAAWHLVDSRVQQLLHKIKAAGLPLGEYVQGRIYRGVLTGYNEAFVIDGTTRQQLMAADARSAEVIKPFLAGRDIKRYRQPESDRYLILLPNGSTKARYAPTSEAAAWQALTADYPAIAAHLAPHEAKARARYDQGQYWWELRACDYYEAFEEPKIMLPDIAVQTEALYDRNGFYCTNTAYIIPSEEEFLVPLLNSNVVQYFYTQISSAIRGGYLRFIRQYLELIPVPNISEENKILLVQLMHQRVALYKSGQSIVDIDEEINRNVYLLFNLSEDEIKLIEV